MKYDRERREIICGNLTEVLRFLYLNQRELSTILSVSQATVSSWINKRTVPWTSTWLALKMVCEIRSEQLYGNRHAVSPAFDIPDITMIDLVRWQLNLSETTKVST